MNLEILLIVCEFNFVIVYVLFYVNNGLYSLTSVMTYHLTVNKQRDNNTN